MVSILYPFVRFKYPDGSLDRRPYSRLPIKVSNPGNGQAIIVWGLVDTGADATLFPASLAISLGHGLKGKGVRQNVTGGIEQTTIRTYSHSFIMELLAPDNQTALWQSRKLEIDCVETEPPILLGVEDFLCHFKLTIDYLSETMRLKW
jgi:hypothetical protein